MLLTDIGKSPDSTFRKINQHLEANYGFKISEDVSDKDLNLIVEQIEGEIVSLKIKGDDSKASPEISKRLLVLEGIRTLREFAMMQFQSPDLENVVRGMTEFVVKHFRLSGMTQTDFDEALRDAMKQYRSSKYRFPDDAIEQRVRSAAMNQLGTLSNGAETSMAETLFDDAEIDESTWDQEQKRSSSLGGHAAGAPDTELGRRAATVLDNPELSLQGNKTDKSVPMIRGKDGRMMPDPFAAQNAARAKGIVSPNQGRPIREHETSEGTNMREQANLVKNLRRLLETEVSQAEVMMAAKGFSTELQEMIEKIGRLQNEDLPPVTDQMRETYGTDSSSAFQTQIYGALQGVMDSLYTAKSQVDDAVTNMAMTGQVSAQTDMDLPVDDMEADPMAADVDASMDVDLDNIGGDLEAEDDFGAAEEEDPLGRSMKAESVRLERKVMEMKKLVAKAKKLKESKQRA
jgi:hypothetical protein